jgi:purine nucleoside phosphorylase
MPPATLDPSVDAALAALQSQEFPAPEILYLLGTGLGTLPGALGGEREVSLGELPGVPTAWSEAQLLAGQLDGARVWLLEDAPGLLESGEGGAGPEPWHRAFPVWLAAAAGATVCVITAAGGSVAEDLPSGELAVLGDHLNLSGATPLQGLGETRLGPLFPDQSKVHHEGLRALALEHARSQGLALSERVCACMAGPALVTPAERRWIASSGSEVFVQGLADPLLACAHSGLVVLALVAVTDDGNGPLRIADLVARSEACAPALEEVLARLSRSLAEVARELEEEVS